MKPEDLKVGMVFGKDDVETTISAIGREHILYIKVDGIHILEFSTRIIDFIKLYGKYLIKPKPEKLSLSKIPKGLTYCQSFIALEEKLNQVIDRVNQLSEEK